MQDGSQPERAAASADAESPADTLQSPTFKRPLTPPGSRNVQTMDRGFTLKQGRLTEHDDGTPKRMRLERERMEESRRTSPGFCFRVGPSTSSSDMGMSPTAAAAGSPALPAAPAATPDAPPAELAGTPVVPPALSAAVTFAATPVLPTAPTAGVTFAATPVVPPAPSAGVTFAATPVVPPEPAPWSRTLQQVQEGRGKSPFSAYVDSLTPLQDGAKSQATGVMPKHSQLLPSPIEGIQPLALLELTPAVQTPTPDRTDAEGRPSGAYGGASSTAGSARSDRGGSPGSARSGGALGMDSARKAAGGPRRLELPHQADRSAVSDMVDRIAAASEEAAGNPEMLLDQMFGAGDDQATSQSLQALFEDVSGLIKPPAPAKSRSKSRQGKPKKCNCKNSKCLKLYCDCFSAGKYCDDCNCTDCLNTATRGGLESAPTSHALPPPGGLAEPPRALRRCRRTTRRAARRRGSRC